MKKIMMITFACGMFMVLGTAAHAVSMEWVTVGDPGNAADTEIMNDGTTGYGSVDYIYMIGKYEVTNQQYCEFLNAVASTDTYGLYNPEMASSVHGGIERSGSPGSYTYSVKTGYENKPVSYVSFYDALRFANWMHNDQPTGDQDASTTEDGAYDMDGDLTTYKPGAQVWLPTEDQWHKAAYYRGGSTNAGYWNYATKTYIVPTAESPPGTNMTNGSVNYDNAVGTITDVGAYYAKPSDSAYGTFDQSGNLSEWNEAIISSDRVVRGGAFDSNIKANYRNRADPFEEDYDIGFRIARRIAGSSGVVIYVDGDAPGNNDGSSWTNAYNYLCDALAVAAHGDELRVAEGVYKPDEDSNFPEGSGDRSATFQLSSGVALCGSYAGYGAPDPNARETVRYETFLSGDLDGDDVPVSGYLGHEGSRFENSYSVVTTTHREIPSILDDLTITGAHATDRPGGGVNNNPFSDGWQIIIVNCTISSNYAYSYNGGGVRYGSGVIANCTITGNCCEGIQGFKGLVVNCTISSNWQYGLYGGDCQVSNCIIDAQGSGIRQCYGLITNCIITGNGTGLESYDGSITSSIINENSTGVRYCEGSITNCMISGNSGDGVLQSNGSFTNCTISGNSRYGIWDCSGSFTNCIIWDNKEGPVYSGAPLITYSDVEGGWSGAGGNNIDVDPCFVDPANDDYHLKSAGGRWSEIGWIIDGESSPCIDAGDPNDDIDDEQEPHGYRINMGAYGGTEQASKTPGLPITFPEPVENFSVTGAHKQIRLYWEPPLDDGGTDILMYKIYRGLTADNLDLYAQVEETELSFSDTDVQNGIVYYYAVSALNGLGEGDQSGALSVTAEWNNLDLNGDGIIDFSDFAIFSNEWLWQASWYAS